MFDDVDPTTFFQRAFIVENLKKNIRLNLAIILMNLNCYNP